MLPPAGGLGPRWEAVDHSAGNSPSTKRNRGPTGGAGDEAPSDHWCWVRRVPPLVLLQPARLQEHVPGAQWTVQGCRVPSLTHSRAGAGDLRLQATTLVFLSAN